MTLRNEIDEYVTERFAADPILSQGLKTGPGGTVTVWSVTDDTKAIEGLLAAGAAFDDTLLGVVQRLADEIDNLREVLANAV